MEVVQEIFAGFKAIMVGWLDYRLTVVPEIGGRILGYSYKGHEMFYVMDSLKGEKADLSLKEGQTIREKRMDLDMRLYGGFKTWLAPQSLWGNHPFIDLDLGPYDWKVTKQEDTCLIDLISPVCRETGMQFYRQICIHPSQREVTVQMGMKNHGEQTAWYGLWDVTQLNGPGVVYFPVRTGGSETAIKQFRTESGISPLTVENQLAKVSCSQQEWFKLGSTYSEGWLLSVLPAQEKSFGYLKRFPVYQGETCAHGCALEVYDSEQFPYFEAEVHAPMVRLKPGESFSFTETWSILELNGDWDRQIRSLGK